MLTARPRPLPINPEEVLESIADPFFALSREWRFVYVNRKAEEILERTPGDLLGKNVWQEFPGLAGTRFEEICKQVMLQGVTQSVTACYPDHDRWYEAHVYPAAYGISIYLNDVTKVERRESELVALADESDHQRRVYEAVLSNTEDFNYVFDLEGRLSYVNQALLTLWKKDLSQVVGKNFFDLNYPDELSERLQQQIKQVIRTCEPVRDETLYTSERGTRSYEYIFVPVIGANGKVEAVAGSTRDITTHKQTEEALRESESRFHNMADHLPVMVWMTDPAGVCTYLNRGWCEYTGQTPEQGLGSGWLEVTHPEDREGAAAAIRAAESRREPFRVEYRLRRFDGVYRWVIDAASPRFGPNGEYLGSVGSVIDISERREMEQALRSSDRRKDEFLAVLAHELRGPLAPLRNGLQIARLTDKADSPLKHTIDMMDRQLNHLVRLVDDLLDMSRISSGKIELRRQGVALGDVLRSSAEASRSLIEARGHELILEGETDDLEVEGDFDRLVQVFSNLLSNSAKYTEPGGSIRIRFERAPHEAIVRISDSGIGIPKEDLDKVFEMFSQVRHHQEHAEGGLGIGLSLVRSLLALHGGSISADSAGLGTGSTFTVRLPLRYKPSVPAESAGLEPATSSGSPKRRIVIADDNEDTVTSLALLLQLEGHVVSTARDGLQAIEQAEAFQPDVVFLDLGMPTLDGLEAARRIRALPRGHEILLVAVTGWGQDTDRQRTREAGFDQHLVKPVTSELLTDVLSASTGAAMPFSTD